MKQLSAEQKVEMVMQILGIHSDPNGGYWLRADVDEDPEEYIFKTFDEALKGVIERERKHTAREISDAVEGWLTGLCVKNPDAGNHPGVTQ
jgi:hypothetical protein